MILSSSVEFLEMQIQIIIMINHLLNVNFLMQSIYQQQVFPNLKKQHLILFLLD